MYEGFFNVRQVLLRHRRFDGGWSPILDREYCEKRDAIVVLPYDPQRDRVVLIEQFRAAAASVSGSAWLIESVAGGCEPDEDLETTARRELLEEAGLQAGALLPVFRGFSSPGHTNEQFHGFLAQVDASDVGGVHGVDDEAEDIRAFALGFDEAITWWREGRIRLVPAIALLLALAAERERLRAEWT